MRTATPENRDLTQGSIYRQLIRIGIPAALGMVFNTLYNLTDNWFAGQISDVALSGLSIASIVFAMFLSLGMGLQSGTSAMVAADLGNRNDDQVRNWINCSLGITFFLSVLILVLGLVFGLPLLQTLSETPEVVTVAWEYTWVILFANVFFNITSCFAGALIAHGNTKSYRNILIFGFFANWLFNPLFIFVFDFGVAGLAWSTAIIKLGSSLYLWRVLQQEVGYWAKPQVDWGHWLQMLKQIMPASMNMLTIIICGFITIYFISQFGDEPVAGYSVGLRIEQVLLLPALGLNAAMLALGGQNFGVDQYQRIRDAYHKALKLGVVVTVGMVPGMVFASPWLVNSFSDTESVATVGVSYMRIDAIAFFAYVVLFISVGTLQSIKQPNFPMILGVFRQILVPVGIYYLLVMYWDFGVNSLFYALVGVVTISAVILYFYTNKQLKKLINS